MHKWLVPLSAGLFVLATSTLAADQTAMPAAPATPSAAAAAPLPVIGELKDGTHVEFSGDGGISILNPDGSKIVPPDGTLTLKDGTTFMVKGGKRIVDDD